MRSFARLLEPNARVCLRVEVVLLHQITPACDSSLTSVLQVNFLQFLMSAVACILILMSRQSNLYAVDAHDVLTEWFSSQC